MEKITIGTPSFSEAYRILVILEESDEGDDTVKSPFGSSNSSNENEFK